MTTVTGCSTNGQRILDPEAVEAALIALANEDPYRVTGGIAYEGECIYTDWAGNPCCLLGHLLERLGLPRPPYGDKENGNVFLPQSMGLWLQLQGVTVPEPEDKIWFLLRWIQVAQDEGKEWREAVELSLGAEAFPPEPTHMGDLA